jgi:transcriptional regulator with XRE-family HTH domain
MLVEFNSERFDTLAKENGDKTLEAICARTGLDMSVVSRLRNRRRQPSITTAVVAAMSYRKSVDHLITVDGQPLDEITTVKDAA